MTRSGQRTQSTRRWGFLWRLSSTERTAAGLFDMTAQRGRRFGEGRRTDSNVSIAIIHLHCYLVVAGEEASSCERKAWLRYAGCGGARRLWSGQSGMFGMRTFLEALDRSIVDCRKANGAKWAGRSPLLGSIAMCRLQSEVHARSASLCIFHARAH
jgi:hypothetical protein